jgi:hypothetical protein
MYLISVMNILTDVAVLTLPFFMMHKVQMTQEKRVKILCAFCARALLVALHCERCSMLMKTQRRLTHNRAARDTATILNFI